MPGLIARDKVVKIDMDVDIASGDAMFLCLLVDKCSCCVYGVDGLESHQDTALRPFTAPKANVYDVPVRSAPGYMRDDAWQVQRITHDRSLAPRRVEHNQCGISAHAEWAGDLPNP
jgi:hypothetical protein